jgi:hypothetical protein
MRAIVRLFYLPCFALLLLLPGARAQAPLLSCPSPHSGPQIGKYSGYTVRLVRSSNRGFRCQAFVAAPGGKASPSKAVAKDWALSINALSGSDINGDGKPDLIVQGYSGGAHCCYTYHIISLSEGLPTLREIRNQVPISFVKRTEGGAEVRTGEGVFDYFLLPHGSAVIPKLFLRLDGDQLVDVGGEHVGDYDTLIEKARSELTLDELDKLRKSVYSQNMFIDQLPAVKKVLTIVLNYLYSGREDQAWHALDEMWPRSDAERVKKLILERRSRGLLHGQSNKPELDRSSEVER